MDALLALLRPLLETALPLLAAAGAATAVPSPSEEPVAAPVPLELQSAPARAEHFLVTRGQPDGPPLEVAVVRLVRLEGAGYTLLEREAVLRDEGWYVHQTERLEGCTRRLAWRELGPTGRRSWIADWALDALDAGTVARVVGYGWRRPVHETLVAGAPLAGELEWLEALRGRAQVAPVATLDPLRAAPRRLAVDPLDGERRVLALAQLGLTGEAAAEVQLYEGLAGPLALHGEALVAFRFAGGWARPCSGAEYSALAQRWRQRAAGRHAIVEAALQRDRTLRTMARLIEAGVPVRWR